jgi:hypothetical protein
MSIKIMSHVWEHSQHKGGDLLLLLAIADHADDQGIAFPSVARLAKKTRMTERNIQLLLKRLLSSRELTIHLGEGPHGCHLYQLTIHDTCLCHGRGENFSPEKPSGVKKVRGEKSGKILPKISPKPSLDPSEELNLKTPPIIPPGGDVGVSGKKVAMPRMKKKTGYPTDPDAQATLRTLVFDAALDGWVREKGLTLDIAAEWERFGSKAIAKGYQYVDWRQAFMNWLTSPYQAHGYPARKTNAQRAQELQDWAEQAMKERTRG